MANIERSHMQDMHNVLFNQLVSLGEYAINRVSSDDDHQGFRGLALHDNNKYYLYYTAHMGSQVAPEMTGLGFGPVVVNAYVDGDGVSHSDLLSFSVLNKQNCDLVDVDSNLLNITDNVDTIRDSYGVELEHVTLRDVLPTEDNSSDVEAYQSMQHLIDWSRDLETKGGDVVDFSGRQKVAFDIYNEDNSDRGLSTLVDSRDEGLNYQGRVIYSVYNTNDSFSDNDSNNSDALAGSDLNLYVMY